MNDVTINGTIKSNPVFSHEVYGENFYSLDISISRLSGQEDVIPVLVSDRLIDVEAEFVGYGVQIIGQLRSYNVHEENKTHLLLNVFVQEIMFGQVEDVNNIYIDGYICKKPVYRKTPLGREITDLMVAVNRSYGKSDYIPCICWGRNARYAAGFEIGQNVKLNGRIQSRTYNKNGEEKVAYEVSVSKVEE